MTTLQSTGSKRALRILAVGSLALVLLLVRPFAVALFLAAVFSAALTPAHRWLARRLRGRSQLAALLLIVVVALLTLGPLATLSAFVVKEAVEASRFVAELVKSEGVEALLNRLPETPAHVLRRLLEWLPGKFESSLSELQHQLSERGGAAAAAVGRAVTATGRFVLQAVLMLIALFFFLTEKEPLVRWIVRSSPLAVQQTRELLEEFRRVAVGVLRSTLLTAGVQTVVALLGYLIAGVPYVIFFSALTFIMALIPAIGAASVCLVTAVLVLALDHPWAALFLALWGVLVVGLSDNVVKPWLLKGDVGLHGAVVFFALLGGLAAFGPVGLLLGPLIAAFFVAVLRIYRRDFG